MVLSLASGYHIPATGFFSSRTSLSLCFKMSFLTCIFTLTAINRIALKVTQECCNVYSLFLIIWVYLALVYTNFFSLFSFPSFFYFELCVQGNKKICYLGFSKSLWQDMHHCQCFVSRVS